MLIDEVELSIKAGDGGDGIVHFFTDRWRPKGGPDGGDGGKGGDVYVLAVSDISKLNQFRHVKKLTAENGHTGGPNQKTGRGGEDLIAEVPLGTVILYDNGTSLELNQVGQKEILAKGGRGGTGNYRFRSATNQTPQQFRPGEKREYKHVRLHLKLIADVGLIGLPNAGKTSLLNCLTSAGAKVANYAFTTLEPNLGVTVGNRIIADIPGLIEGASQGKGLGSKFLKHIERTRLLIHCLSAESQNPVHDYQVVRHELESHSSSLANKKEIIIITKSDLVTPAAAAALIDQTKALMAVSIEDTHSLKKLNDYFSQILDREDQKPVSI